jgi:phospholipid/cholesterol/gamma-HCH transport system ATP-binding protein
MTLKDNIQIVLQVKNLKKRFGDKKVLNGFSMQLYEGENLVIMGKSGSGKSVMIKCLVGLLNADEGSIEIAGKNISKLSANDFNILRSEIGFLFQGSALYDSMTVRENLEFPLRRSKKTTTEIDTLVQNALENVGLLYAIDLMPEELSGGMKRRVALARAIILKPKIIIFDEPTTGLDPITSKEIIELMKTIQKQYNTSSIIITHDIDCARVIANRMLLLIDGINYAEGTYKTLTTSNDPKIKAFFK